MWNYSSMSCNYTAIEIMAWMSNHIPPFNVDQIFIHL